MTRVATRTPLALALAAVVVVVVVVVAAVAQHLQARLGPLAVPVVPRWWASCRATSGCGRLGRTWRAGEVATTDASGATGPRAATCASDSGSDAGRGAQAARWGYSMHVRMQTQWQFVH